MQLDILKDDDASTEVGSYFVANYPPFSAWTADQVPDALAVLDTPAEANSPGSSPLGLYLHIPFCRKRCKFCYYRVYTDKNSRQVDEYIQALAAEIALYAQKPCFDGRQFEFVYFGGGTPSYLSSAQLTRLVDLITEHWTWSSAKEVTFECEPGTLRKGKLETIKQIGVTRLSLGVEHFDDEVLEVNGRAHKSPEILRSYEWARQVGFDQLNIDLIAGMVGDTDAKWRDTVDKALALDPDSVTLYQMELPPNTEFSRQARQNNGQSPVADWATKRAWVDHAMDLFGQHGYQVSGAYTLVKPSDRSSFIYRDALWHGADMVGTGVSSFSFVSGVHYQNAAGWDDYVGKIQQGDLPVARGLVPTPGQLLIRELVLQLKTGGVNAGYFRQKFGRDIMATFGEAFGALRREGHCEIQGDQVSLTRKGLLRVDALLPCFFEAQHRSIC
ncbi:MAG: coproporphyrinogen-III oxidase family protein [Phycisphaerae bacterium]